MRYDNGKVQMKLILLRKFFVSSFSLEAEGHFLVTEMYFPWGGRKMLKVFMIILELVIRQ